MTLHPHPDVPLPNGAQTSDLWSNWNDELRVISTEDYEVDGFGTVLYASAIQFRDGTIDLVDDTPKVWLDDTGLTAEKARELAGVISRLADIVDDWSGVERPDPIDAISDLLTRVDRAHSSLRGQAAATTTDATFAAYSEIAARVITAKLALADALDAVEVAAR
jgi:hypothetical protein